MTDKPKPLEKCDMILHTDENRAIVIRAYPVEEIRSALAWAEKNVNNITIVGTKNSKINSKKYRDGLYDGFVRSRLIYSKAFSAVLEKKVEK